MCVRERPLTFCAFGLMHRMKNGSDVLSVAIRACKESCSNSEQRRMLLAVSR